MIRRMPTYPIETDRLYLRPFDEGDLDDVYEYTSRPDVTRYLPWDVRNRQQTREVLSQKVKRTTLKELDDIFNLAVVLKETGRLIGDLTLFLRSNEYRQGEVGYVFNPDYHGRGYATEAAQVMLQLGFETFNFHRIYARCDPRNIGSWKLMERLGMRREAHFIHNEIFKGEWGDEFIYAILEDEWRAKYG
ncbi:MAG: GNAT family N-acetyltransferase, partial [candidate division Zixibacteria bacterium]|nr:GNAT family N-acetyltransferase [candidate division Zixibacteria bacterium]NIW42712.1 GNAT family N-acetyltransferase [candidate division Zixibacteria bacterium]